jgi:hypothetical protein
MFMVATEKQFLGSISCDKRLFVLSQDSKAIFKSSLLNLLSHIPWQN